MKRAIFIAAVFAMAACRDSTPPPVPTTMILSTSSASFDALGATQSVVATIKDQHDQPMTGVQVTWTSSSTAATVVATPATTTTPPSAVITAAANGTATITATAGKATATVIVQITQVAVLVQKASGDAQTGTVNVPLVTPLRVIVLDRLGVPIVGHAVTFAITQGSGTLISTSTTSAADGSATTGWVLGKVAADAQEVAVTAGTASARFTATAVAGAPVVLAVAAGQSQQGTVGAALPTRPTARVADAFDNPVRDVVVRFTPASASGSIEAPLATTNAAGLASAGLWTLGTTPGTKTLAAAVDNLAGVTFTATAVVGPPASVVAIAGTTAFAAPGATITVPPSVRVTDTFSNPIAGVTVTFAVTGGGGSITGAATTTNSNGVATLASWTLGSSTGLNTVSATVSGLTSVTFSVNAATTPAPTPGGTVVASGSSNQAAMAGTAVPAPPSVIVRDNAGAPLAGVSVTFSVTAGGGSVTGATTTTNASGVATVGSWILGSVAAPNTLTATVTGSGFAGSPVSFTGVGCTGGGAGYAITVCYRSSMTATQRAAFQNAAARWGSIIVADLPDTPLSFGAGSCGTGTPSLNMLVDDLVIFAAIETIDGVGNVLGSAGPCFIRSGGLPVAGSMRFDVADVAGLEATSRLEAVILHEMGHVLGIGTVWRNFGMLINPSSTGAPLDTYFSGVNAITAFDAAGGATYTGGQKVPVENSFGSGTINSHWRESVLANELMTGFINTGSNPLSALTVQSLADIGYTVNPAGADPFFLTLALRASVEADHGRIALGNDAYTGPLYTVDTKGRMVKIR